MSTQADQMDEETQADYRESFESAETPEEALALVRDFMEPVQGTNPTYEAMHEMLERIVENADGMDFQAQAHAKAQGDLDAVKGKTLVIPEGHHISGYDEDEMFEEIKLTSPAIVRVNGGTIDTHNPGIELTDPQWNIDLACPHRQLDHLNNLVVYAPNYSRKTGRLGIFRPEYKEFEGEIVRIRVKECLPREMVLTIAVDRPVYNGLVGTSDRTHKDGGLIQDKHDGLTPVLEAIRAAGLEGNDTTRVKIVED